MKQKLGLVFLALAGLGMAYWYVNLWHARETPPEASFGSQFPSPSPGISPTANSGNESKPMTTATTSPLPPHAGASEKEENTLLVDPQVQQTITQAHFSESVKKLLLEGSALIENKNKLDPPEFFQRLSEYRQSLKSENSNVASEMSEFIKTHPEMQQFFKNDLLFITAQMDPVKNSDIQELARTQLQTLAKAGNSGGDSEQTSLTQAMVSLVNASSGNETAAWKSIEASINLNDAAQVSAMDAAKHSLQMRKKTSLPK